MSLISREGDKNFTPYSYGIGPLCDFDYELALRLTLWGRVKSRGPDS